jgi:O-antigen ligase
MHDRRGLLAGNGYNGQYRVRLLEGVAKLWEEPNSYNLHMHSAFLEILVNQGIIGILLMYVVYWIGYKRYRAEYRSDTAMAPLFAGFTYLLFVWQIDITGYSYYLGYILLFMLMSPLCIKKEAITGKRKALNGAWLT